MNDLSGADRQYVYAVVRRILKTEDAASDVTQDACLLAHRHRDQFRGDSAHRTWLYRIAVTTALGYLRKQRRSREELTAAGLAGTMVDPRPSPEQEVLGKELASKVDEFIATLDAKHRDVFVMRAADQPETEIADALGISLANVKIRAHRARARLRASLGETGFEVSDPAPRGPRARPDSPADSSATSPAS